MRFCVPICPGTLFNKLFCKRSSCKAGKSNTPMGSSATLFQPTSSFLKFERALKFSGRYVISFCERFSSSSEFSAVQNSLGNMVSLLERRLRMRRSDSVFTSNGMNAKFSPPRFIRIPPNLLWHWATASMISCVGSRSPWRISDTSSSSLASWSASRNELIDRSSGIVAHKYSSVRYYPSTMQ